MTSDFSLDLYDARETGRLFGARKLLVVSDLHLGRDAAAITGGAGARPDDSFDQAFIELLDVYTSAQESKWRLILNGDVLDFVELVITPARLRLDPLKLYLSFKASEEEKAYGLGTQAERSTAKLEAILKLHEGLFRRLAHFVREGGELVFIRGNHDAELHWEKVQRALRRRLASWAFQGQKMDVDEALDIRNAFQARVQICPWMYYEPGRIYLEHGHQYDVYCSFDTQLYPVSPTNPKRIDTPIFMFTMRYFANLLADFSPEYVDHWRGRDYLDWLKRQGPGGVLYVLRMGLYTGYRALRHAFALASGHRKEFKQEHQKRLGQQAERFGLTEDQVLLADRLHHVPVTRNLSELMRLLFLDRLLLIAVALFFCFLVLISVDSVAWELFLIAMIGSAAYQLNRRMVPRRYLLPGPKQAQAARQLAKIFKVPNVVMGHSHVRRVLPLKRGGYYFNTGSWLPPTDGHAHQRADEPCNCRLSHLVVEGDKAQLRNFCRVTKTIREVDADLRGQSLEVEQDARA